MATELSHHVKPIHFFKIIHSHSQSLREGKLMIPRKFVEKYGEGLPETIYLKPPNGAAWKLNLVKCGGKMWFQKGWKEFVEYHSLAHGYLLVFKYQGTSKFQVHIFDKSALEINYPFKRVVEPKSASNGKGNKCPNDENLEDHRAGQKRKVASSFEFLQPFEVGSSSGVKVGNTLKFPNVPLQQTYKKGKGKQSITGKEVTTLDRASSFKTCNPSFLLVMPPSYIEGRGPMNFPKKFVERHLKYSDKKHGEVHLRVLNGKVWPARYLNRIAANGKPKFELTGGWKAFGKDNNLKVDDVCVFELIPGNKLTFEVHIFRETDNPSCSTSQKSSKMKEATQGHRNQMKVTTSGKQIITTAKKVSTIDNVGSLETCNPSFHVNHPSDVKAPRHLNLPNEFGKRHLDLGKMLGEQAMSGLGCSHFLGKQIIAAEEVTALDRAKSLETCNPSFHVVMRQSYVEASCHHLCLPSEFGKRHLDLGNKHGDIHLQVLNGRVWPAKLVIWTDNIRTRFFLMEGWKAFVKDNNLKAGDVCTFELIPGTQFTFQVHIFKNLPKREKLLEDKIHHHQDLQIFCKKINIGSCA